MFGAGDEMFADSYPMREVEDGFFYEVDGTVSIFVLAPFSVHAALTALCTAAYGVSCRSKQVRPHNSQHCAQPVAGSCNFCCFMLHTWLAAAKRSDGRRPGAKLTTRGACG